MARVSMLVMALLFYCLFFRQSQTEAALLSQLGQLIGLA